MDKSLKQLLCGIFIAASLWFVMFSPWTKDDIDFWLAMSISGTILTAYATLVCREWIQNLSFSVADILIGVGLAALFWGVFFVGDKLSQLLFSFARGQVDLIYTLKSDEDGLLVAALLMLLIGPAEEIFWRGFVQRRLMERTGRWWGWGITTFVYALVHLWSFNFMLIMAALVIGALWGGVYMMYPKHLGIVIVSHALWDAAAFVFFPF